MSWLFAAILVLWLCVLVAAFWIDSVWLAAMAGAGATLALVSLEDSWK